MPTSPSVAGELVGDGEQIESPSFSTSSPEFAGSSLEVARDAASVANGFDEGLVTSKAAERERKRIEKYERQQPHIHGVEAIRTKRIRKLLAQHRLPDEQLIAVVVGVPESQVIVALDSRLLIVKTGVHAGATGGGRVTSFRYQDVVGIQVNTGIVNGTLIVLTAGVNTTVGDFWATGGFGATPGNTSSRKLPNSIPINKTVLRTYAKDLEVIKQIVRDVGSGGGLESQPRLEAPPDNDGPDVVVQLQRLVDLHRSGALDDQEFADAKRRILDAE